MKKTSVKKTTTKKRTTSSKASKAAKRQPTRVAAKANDVKCDSPTTLFEVEFPTTVLFWAGIALFFLFILLIAQSVL